MPTQKARFVVTDAPSTDARSAALGLMVKALRMLDSDPTISGIPGSHLQMAIDSLCRGNPIRNDPRELH